MVEAIERNLQECLCSFRLLPGAVALDSSHLVSIKSPIPLSFTNGVALTRFDEPNLKAQVDAVVGPYQEDGLPFRWWVTPSSTPASLGEALVAKGMTKRFQIPGMGIDLAKLQDNFEPPQDFSIERVSNPRDLKRWADAFTIAFDMNTEESHLWVEVFTNFGFGDDSPWRLYAGILDGEAIATSSMFIGSGAVGIYHVVTHPQARGKNIGSLMTVAPLREAAKLGHRTGVLQSSAMGLPVYERLGFKTYFLADFYTWRPAAASEA